jgi:hypothetical protein
LTCSWLSGSGADIKQSQALKRVSHDVSHDELVNMSAIQVNINLSDFLVRIWKGGKKVAEALTRADVPENTIVGPLLTTSARRI